MLNYDKIKEFYNKKYWTNAMVRDAVVKNKIDEDEYLEITGERY